MSQEEINKLLNGSDEKTQKSCRLLLEGCREPTTWGRLKKIKMKKDPFKILCELKKAGAVGFKDGKYFATEEGLKILKGVSEG